METDMISKVKDWLGNLIECIEGMEGEVKNISKIGGSLYVKFESGNTYVVSFQKNTNKVCLDKHDIN